MNQSIKLCHYSVVVQEIADYGAFSAQAKESMTFRNDKIIARDGNLGDEFWFLSFKIKGRKRIIVNATGQEIPEDDPAFTEKLSDFLEEVKNDEGHAKKRGFKQKGNTRNRNY